MLLYLFITCFSLILFLNSLAVRPSLPPGVKSPTDLRLLSLWFWKELSIFSISSFDTNSFNLTTITSKLSFKSMTTKFDNNSEEETLEMSILDLPELVLETILHKLPPSGLCSMAGVCSSLRGRCMSDHLWEKHMKQKWGGIIDPAACREWQPHLASKKDSSNLKQGKQRLWARLTSILRLLSFSWTRLKVEVDNDTCKQRPTPLPVNSVMSWYLALESGRFWFPAQVYNREKNRHVGFMLSCYDAELSYDSRTDTFQARYQPHGRRVIAIESGVSWDRLRAPPVDTSPHDLHMSDCLRELRPGDHIEIQWRRNKEFPYGWWYGVVGHLESCDGNENYCRCLNSDAVVLEFNQYTPGSRWRQKIINRKDHREEGDEADGFYGGIRKLKSDEEINIWKRLWPVEFLE